MVIEDYREFLKTKLEERLGLNPRYSLRAFARDLGLPATRLSQIIRGRQGLSESSARQVASRLNLSSGERELFCALVNASDARSKTSRKAFQTKVKEIKQSVQATHVLHLDAFRVMADWYHYALMELTTLEGFRNDPLWIAKRLGVSELEIKSAIARLKRLGLLKQAGMTLVQTHNNLATPLDTPSDAVRKFNVQILQKALQALERQPREERDFSTLTVAIPSSEMPVLRDRIKDFRRSFNKHIETHSRSKTADEVYTLAIQFFRVTEKEST